MIAFLLLGVTLTINGVNYPDGQVNVSVPTSSPTPAPIPTQGPPVTSATPKPTPPPSGNCPQGYVKLDKPLTFASNTYGLDGVTVPIGQTLHYCTLFTASAKLVKFRTADRTGPSQCSNVRLTVSPPDGREPSSSQAVNNSINIYGTVPTGNLAPTGAYLVDLYGGQPSRDCTSQQVLLYWQY